MLIIADIAGQIDALTRLVARVPQTMPVVLLGDLVDRGYYSAEVIEWAMENAPRVRVVMGNHEHMMLDYYDNYGIKAIYGEGIWLGNGGDATRASYSRKYNSKRPPEEHLAWLRGLPLYIEEDGLLMSHAPFNANFENIQEMAKLTKENPLMGDWSGRKGSLLWNRSQPKDRENVFQIFGHNSHWGLQGSKNLQDLSTSPMGHWICLDQSQSEILTGLLWDKETKTFQILEETYLRRTEPVILSAVGEMIKDSKCQS